jgi:glycosyltransferase involved in cell wall biosynthesis
MASPRIRLIHSGEVYGLRSPFGLIEALGELRQEDIKLYNSLNISFFGNVEQKDRLIEQARSLGVEGALVFGGQIGHEEALNHLSQADVLLLLGVKGSKPEIQVPSKLFEYLALERPILSLSKRGGAIHDILKESGIPFLLADLEDVQGIKSVLMRTAHNDFDGGEDWRLVENYGFDRLAHRLSGLMIDLKSGGPRPV